MPSLATRCTKRPRAATGARFGTARLPYRIIRGGCSGLGASRPESAPASSRKPCALPAYGHPDPEHSRKSNIDAHTSRNGNPPSHSITHPHRTRASINPVGTASDRPARIMPDQTMTCRSFRCVLAGGAPSPSPGAAHSSERHPRQVEHDMSRQDAMKTKRIAAEETKDAALPMNRKEFETELRKLGFCRNSGIGTRKQQVHRAALMRRAGEIARRATAADCRHISPAVCASCEPSRCHRRSPGHCQQT